MGGWSFSSDAVVETSPLLNKNHFKIHDAIGRGAFGKVWKVEMKKNALIYAMKILDKNRIICRRLIKSVMNERTILSWISSEFIVNMRYAFQDRQNLYLICDFLPGGDLRYNMRTKRHFQEDEARFIICCIILGLGDIHKEGFVHRDIKPENIVLDEKGYARITDFGIAREVMPNNYKETSGTPGYMSPEVLWRQNHGYAVDFYALGVILYEIMLGRRPYKGKTRKEIRDQVLESQAEVTLADVPKGWSEEVADLINLLIMRRPELRIGVGGVEEVMDHPWFNSIIWEDVRSKRMTPPDSKISGALKIPQQNIDNFSDKQVNGVDKWLLENKALYEENKQLLKRDHIQDQFKGYFYFNST